MNYFASGDRSLSAFVTGEYMIWHAGEMELVVLWRGSSPRWYSGSGSKRGSGTAQGYEGSVQFGPQQFDFRYDRVQKIVRVRNVEVSLAQGENVVLIDGADRDGAPSIRALRSDLTYAVKPGRGAAPAPPGNEDIVAMLRRSAEIVSFLRCDDASNAQLPARVSGYFCTELKSK
jgi:hypothetical protein